jgi:UDPglucose 6-dehydrogenase
MKLTVIGTGYVGLISGACFAEMGNTVTCVDRDADRIAQLARGILPLYEPGLDALVARNCRQGRLRFTTSLPEAVADSHVHFVAVGTPPREDGGADLQHVLAVASEIGKHLAKNAVVVNKSTAPIGTAEQVDAVIARELHRRGVKLAYEVVSNPEFLKEGDAINDFMRPDRIVVGCESEKARELMRELYAPFMRSRERVIFMGVREAEMTKYAANAMLATKISFMNEIAGLCDRLGVDVEAVRQGIGSDSRIGYAFIYPGAGYGGSCFPKDVKALIHLAEQQGLEAHLLKAVEARNNAQKQELFRLITARFGKNLKGLSVGVWGLSFKPGTDDLREAPSKVLLEALLDAGAHVKAYDPVAMGCARKVWPAAWFEHDRLVLAEHQYDALTGADALALVTEWRPFRYPDFDLMKRIMNTPVIFDGRNQYDPKYLQQAGFEYRGIGRGQGPDLDNTRLSTRVSAAG